MMLPSPYKGFVEGSISRHTVVRQWPRNQKKTRVTQVCYLLVP